MKVLLDTNFILTCVKQKIDFFEEIKLMGFEILIPRQVINELEILKGKKKPFNNYAMLSLKLLKNERGFVEFRKVDLGNNKTDVGIIKFADKNQNVIIATLDNGIQNKIKNKKLIIRGKKKLEIA